jgi:predicted O-linked N-acetylglucosamine transferase (SPINDLY family)/nucleoside-diphosphate-sugar epimerase
MNAPRVLLTGASGFVGRQAIGPLLDLGYEVHAVGHSVTDPRARWYRADLLDQTARRQLVAAARPDALLHCAWITRPGAFWDAPENLDWVAASLDLARAAAGHGTRRFLMVGSAAEYDQSAPGPRAWREDDPCRPTSLYGTAKDALHRLLARFMTHGNDQGISFVWARLFNLYGPQQNPERMVPALLSASREGRRHDLGSGKAIRDLMHVADAGRALAHLLAGDANGAINVASGRPVTIGALAGIAARLAGRSDLPKLDPRPPKGPLTLTADVTRLLATGFVPSITLEDGLSTLWAMATPPPGPMSMPPPDYERAARLYRAGRMEESRAVVEAVLAREPDHAPALNLLGVLHRLRGDFSRAQTCLRRATALDPEKETAWINLGNVLLDMEQADAAVDAYDRALAAAPARADTFRLLGNALARSGRDAEAIAALDKAVATANPLEALRDRARAHFTAARFEQALADLDAALTEQPDDVGLRLIKAQMLRLSGARDAAAALLRELLAHAPDSADVHLAMADALLAEEKREPANEHYRRATELRPDDDHALGRYCWSLLNSRYGKEADHIARAVEIARRMVAKGVVHPASAHAVQSALLRVADLDGLAAFDVVFPDRRVLLAYWVRRNVVGALHAQLGRVRTMDDRLALMQCHREWGRRYEAKVAPIAPRRGPSRPRIRVGIVSSDLRNHPVSYFAQPIFDHYDRERFELFAYSFHPGGADNVQREIESKVLKFRRMPNMPEQDIARIIADDALDILFELGGSTHLNRLEVMAHQPAPVQVSWLGYPHSSGLSRIGHVLVDPYLKPPDPRLLLERPFEMPSSWVTLGSLGFGEQEIAAGLPEERAGRLTFGTMNNPYKYAPEAIALWSRVLRAVPGSRFLIVRPEAGVTAFREAMARAFERHDIEAGRLAYVAVRGTHMRYYNDIDIALDTLPQTGGTTTCECLWMGVPTVSLVGPALFERLSFTNLVNAGLADLAVASPDAYVAAAVALAADVTRRRALRRDLRETIRRSPLGDTKGWVRDFEALTMRTLDAGGAAL